MVIFPKGRFSIKVNPLEVFKKTLQLYHMPGKLSIVWKIGIFIKLGLFMLQLIFLTQAVKHVKGLTGIITTFPLAILAILKTVLMHSNKERIKIIYSTIDYEFWDFHIAEPKTIKHIEFRFKIVTHLCLNIIIIASVFLTIFGFVPFIELPEGVVRYPIGLWFPFYTGSSPIHEIIYAFCMCSVYLSFWLNVFYDFLFIYAGQHTTIQFIMLSDLLKNLSTGLMEHSNDLDKFNSNDFQKRVMDRLVICCKHHQILVKYAQILREYAYLGFLGQVAFMIVLLVAGIIYLENLDINKDFVKLGMVMGIMFGVFQDLVMCAVQSTDLNNSSMNLADAAYLSEWHLYRAPIKRALVLLMANAQRGINITAGNMIKVDNEIIVFVLQKIVSLITLLHTMQEKADMNHHHQQHHQI